MKSFRIGVIGPFKRGEISLMAHRPDEGFRIVAVCGRHLDVIEPYRKACGDELFETTDYRELLARRDIDTVFVCTPDRLHAEHAVAALEAGKNVFLEKPIAITIADCDRILAAAENSEGRLYVGHNMRFFPVMRKMHELIQAGRIGRVEAVWCRHFVSYGGDAYFKDWHSEREFIHGLLLQKGAHDIDIIHWLAGAHTTRVVGMGKLSVYNEVTDRRAPGDPPPARLVDRKNWPPLAQRGLSPKIDIEDHSMILMQLANGVQASYQQCHYTPDSCRNYTVIGTEGRLENSGDASTPQRWSHINLWTHRSGGFSELGHEVFRVPPAEGTHGGADPLMIEDFLRFLRGEPSESATLADARAAVVTGICGTDSLRDGSTPRDVPAYRTAV